MKKLLLISALSVMMFPAVSQIVLTGKTINSKDGTAIPFVNIGILNSDVGTISDEDGSFLIKITKQHATSSLYFSALGYKKLSLSIDSLKKVQFLEVAFEEDVTQLKPVTVTGKKFRRKFLFGNDTSEGGTVYADTVTAGSSIAVLIDNNLDPYNLKYPKFECPALVENVAVRVAKNTFKEFRLRVRLYAVDPVTGLPGDDLLNKSIVAASNIKKGWLEIDLLNHFITVNGPFYLGFEWILEKKDRQYLHEQYSSWRARHPELVTVEYANVDGEEIPYVNYNAYFWAGTSLGIAVSPKYLEQFKCYYRYSSFSVWTRSSSILAATVRLSN